MWLQKKMPKKKKEVLEYTSMSSTAPFC